MKFWLGKIAAWKLLKLTGIPKSCAHEIISNLIFRKVSFHWMTRTTKSNECVTSTSYPIPILSLKASLADSKPEFMCSHPNFPIRKNIQNGTICPQNNGHRFLRVAKAYCSVNSWNHLQPLTATDIVKLSKNCVRPLEGKSRVYYHKKLNFCTMVQDLHTPNQTKE